MGVRFASRFPACLFLALLVCSGTVVPAAAQTGAVEGDEDPGFFWHLGLQADPEQFRKDWFVSDFNIKKPSFRTGWSRKSVRVKDGALELVLRPSRGQRSKDFVGAELQRRPTSLYGRYEVIMTPARGEGVISSFFTYTGPYFGTQHDEIDFEFLGRDTTKVWLNRFVDGQKLPGQWLDLGFDAAEAPHLYAFEWTPEAITWSVDGRELLKVSAEDTALPTTPSKIYFNIWAGGEKQKDWSGVAPDDMQAAARYYCISHRRMGSDMPQCSDSYPSQ